MGLEIDGMATQEQASETEPDELERSGTPGPVGAATVLPPLENGDRLTRPEFERRYEAMPRLKKAELIEGVVYVPSPVRYQQHGQPHSTLVGWLIVYCAATPGVGHAVFSVERGGA